MEPGVFVFTDQHQKSEKQSLWNTKIQFTQIFTSISCYTSEPISQVCLLTTLIYNAVLSDFICHMADLFTMDILEYNLTEIIDTP